MSDNVIDRAALDRLLTAIGGDMEDLEELLDDFAELGPQTLSKMKSAAAERDLDTLRISAHSLKSNARDFGAMALAAQCERTERAAVSGEIDDPAAYVASIEHELDRARAALANITGSHG